MLPVSVQATAAGLTRLDPDGRNAPFLDLTAELRGLRLPDSLNLPLGGTMQSVDFAATVVGELPPPPWAPALTAWRDAGGNVQVRRFELDYGSLAVWAGGTLALDGDLQPIGTATAKVTGFVETIDTLRATGIVQPRDAVAAMMVLGRVGPRPIPAAAPATLNLPLVLQNRRIFAGPVAADHPSVDHLGIKPDGPFSATMDAMIGVVRVFVLAVALLLVPLPGTGAGRDVPRHDRYLVGSLLIAAPGMPDPRFAETVIYIVEHDSSGAFGLVVNRPMGEFNLGELMRALGLNSDSDIDARNVAMRYGGPVQPELLWVLHGSDWTGQGHPPCARPAGDEHRTRRAGGHRPRRRAAPGRGADGLCGLGAGPVGARDRQRGLDHRARGRRTGARRRRSRHLAPRHRNRRHGALN